MRLNIMFCHPDREVQDKIISLFEYTDKVRVRVAQSPETIPQALRERDYQIAVLSMSVAELDEGRFIYNLVNEFRMLQIILVAPIISLKSLLLARELGADDVVFKTPHLTADLEESIRGLAQKLQRWHLTLEGHYSPKEEE